LRAAHPVPHAVMKHNKLLTLDREILRHISGGQELPESMGSLGPFTEPGVPDPGQLERDGLAATRQCDLACHRPAVVAQRGVEHTAAAGRVDREADLAATTATATATTGRQVGERTTFGNQAVPMCVSRFS
jgi:uncharacterized heparinase superfamily protein